MTTDARERVQQAWDVLAATCLVERRGGSLLVLEGPHGAGAPIWPAGQVLTAAILVGSLTGDLDPALRILRGLESFRSGDGYRERPRRRRRYFDDNAWMGLALIQLHLEASRLDFDPGTDLLARAHRVYRFIIGGQDPDGGVRWVARRLGRHACSTAPAAELALRLHLHSQDRREKDPAPLDIARGGLDWLTGPMRRNDGLIADHDAGPGPSQRNDIDPTVWSYNQGTTVGALGLLHRVSGDSEPLAAGLELAARSLAHFEGERLWTHPPAFNAIWLRNLLAFGEQIPVIGLTDRVDEYLDRVWREARDPRTGLFTAGGIGSYDGRPALDHAGLTQLFALRARGDDIGEIC
jgi:hypothetical protein